LYTSPNIVRVIKSRRRRRRRRTCTWLVMRMEEMRNAYKILIGKPEGNT
jgi:hypothetical protein